MLKIPVISIINDYCINEEVIVDKNLFYFLFVINLNKRTFAVP
jgi:hypothetical protein